MARKADLAIKTLLESPYDAYVAWASQLGVEWSRVIARADVKDPNNGRTNRKRMKAGEAPEVREKLFDTLQNLEVERKTTTEIGAVLRGLKAWTDLGERLARVDPAVFLDRLEAARQMVAAAEQAAAASQAFRSIK
jgi:hypothetical protein